MLKAVAFDLDGVLTDTAEYHYLAWKELGKKIGIDFDREFNEKLKGISREESLELILSLGDQQKAYTPEEKTEMMVWKNDLYIELIQNITKKDILPGILPLLEALKENNIKMAIASASKNAPMILEKLGIIPYFDTIVDPSSIANGKPFPDIFIAASEQLNIPVSQMIGIEDSQAGITSINDAQMFSVGVGVLEQANYLVPSTTELDFNSIIAQFNN